MNPTEYMTEAGLRALIRNPQAVYDYPHSGMDAFLTTLLPDTDIDDLIAYLRYMARHKVP